MTLISRTFHQPGPASDGPTISPAHDCATSCRLLQTGRPLLTVATLTRSPGFHVCDMAQKWCGNAAFTAGGTLADAGIDNQLSVYIRNTWPFTGRSSTMTK